jgi:hypothetical protein
MTARFPVSKFSCSTRRTGRRTGCWARCNPTTGGLLSKPVTAEQTCCDVRVIWHPDCRSICDQTVANLRHAVCIRLTDLILQPHWLASQHRARDAPVGLGQQLFHSRHMPHGSPAAAQGGCAACACACVAHPRLSSYRNAGSYRMSCIGRRPCSRTHPARCATQPPAMPPCCPACTGEANCLEAATPSAQLPVCMIDLGPGLQCRHSQQPTCMLAHRQAPGGCSGHNLGMLPVVLAGRSAPDLTVRFGLSAASAPPASSRRWIWPTGLVTGPTAPCAAPTFAACWRTFETRCRVSAAFYRIFEAGCAVPHPHPQRADGHLDRV